MGSSLTLGNFDGIHLGHQSLLQRTVTEAKARQIPSVVVTYFPNPAVVLGKRENFKYLSSQSIKTQLIESFQIDYLIELPFTESLSKMSAEAFLEDIIIGQLHAKYIVIGYNHFFGSNRRGDYQLLKDNANKYSYDVELQEAVSLEGEKISSSYIRKKIESGDLRTANELLGRTFFLEGRIMEGQKRGRTIQYPTANLEIPTDVILPAIGVYACYTHVQGKKFPSMVNVGLNPTFDGQTIHIESHIFDFSGDIYGETMQIHFVEKIRDEKKFDGIDALRGQLALDEKNSREILSRSN